MQFAQIKAPCNRETPSVVKALAGPGAPAASAAGLNVLPGSFPMSDFPPTRPALPCPFAKVHPSQLVRDDEFFMWQAYNLAIDAWRADEVPIGAVIELGGEIIASAHNQRDSTRDPTAHAEIIAFGQAARAIGDWRLNDATLYVTKEPCPMCSGATLMSRVKRVVFAVPIRKWAASAAPRI